jgi:hypothetical protein
MLIPIKDGKIYAFAASCCGEPCGYELLVDEYIEDFTSTTILQVVDGYTIFTHDTNPEISHGGSLAYYTGQYVDINELTDKIPDNVYSYIITWIHGEK